MYQNLKDSISAIIRDNDNSDITGDFLQTQLFAMISKLGVNHFKGEATPTTTPAADFEEGFYIGLQAGTYPSFGNFTINSGAYVFWKTGGAWRTPVNIANGLLSQLGIGDGATVAFMSKIENISPATLMQDSFMNLLAFGGGGPGSGTNPGDITTQLDAVMTGAIPVGENKFYTFWGYGDSHVVGAYNSSLLSSSSWIGPVSTTQVNSSPEAQKILTPPGCTHINVQVKIGGESVTGFYFTEGSEYTTSAGKVIIDGAIDGAWIIQTKDLLGKIQEDQLSQSLQDKLDDYESRISTLEM